MALVADLADGHKRSGHSSNLEDGLNVLATVAQVELALTHVGNGAAIPHENFLPTATTCGLPQAITRAVIDGAYVNH